MSTGLTLITDALFRDDTVIVDAGSRGISDREMFFLLRTGPADSDDQQLWHQPIPDEMVGAEAEYYAVIKGLQAAAERDCSVVVLSTNSEPVLDHLRDGGEPSPELQRFYEMAVRLRELFDEVRLIYYGG